MHVADLTTVLAGIIYGIWSKPVPPMTTLAGEMPIPNADMVLDPNSSKALCRSQFRGEADDDEEADTDDDDGNDNEDDGDCD